MKNEKEISRREKKSEQCRAKTGNDGTIVIVTTQTRRDGTCIVGAAA